jgi:hypothetical protein
MHYYLEDERSRAVIFISDNIFLVNNIKSGIIDCNLFVFDQYTDTVKQIEEHLKLGNDSIGIKIGPTGPIKFSLENLPEVKSRQRLARLRKPLYENLLANAKKSTARSYFGFNIGDEVYIKNALTDDNAISEYASVIGLDPQVAKDELTMLVDSMFQEKFRTFTLCTKWKEQINKVETSDEAARLLPLITKSFFISSILDA